MSHLSAGHVSSISEAYLVLSARRIPVYRSFLFFECGASDFLISTTSNKRVFFEGLTEFGSWKRRLPFDRRKVFHRFRAWIDAVTSSEEDTT
jgi:hypothetical protein